uniref:Odorant receptor n=1 Tax=Campoletis chlorideae TaxID=219166 RepID=A0A346D432_9HYME|nr:odorant receptor [Campoletis chlorideae]
MDEAHRDSHNPCSMVSLSRAVEFTKWSVILVCTWPPSKGATMCQTIRADIAWCLSFLSVFCLLIPLSFSIYKYRTDSIIMTQSTGLTCACIMIIIKTLVLRIHRNKCQLLIDEMEEFINSCNEKEKQVLQSYVDKCWIFYGCVTIINYMGAVPVIFGPFVYPHQRFPTFAVYPFPVETGIIAHIVFIHQCFTGLQCSAAFTIDCQMALLMWFAGARLEILARQIKHVDDPCKFRSFVQKHQRLLSYVNQVSGTMCYIALATTFICSLASVMFSLQLVGNQPLAIRMQYGPATIVALVNLLICAWPTENIIRVCDLIGTNIYNTPWFEMSPKLSKGLIMILQRTQRGIRVSIGGFLPALSFRFYASFLSAVFSYFTTIRLVIMSDTDL